MTPVIKIMTELEIMQRAKMYIDNLANGIDPITDSEMPDDTVLNNARLIRCFFYVSGVLQKVIDNGGVVKKSGSVKKNQFTITPEEIARVPISETPLPITHFCGVISDSVSNSEDTRKLGYNIITDWLIKNEYLRIEVINGAKKKRAGKYAANAGIIEETRTGYNGEYTAMLYTSEAQRFILDNLLTIIAAANESYQ
jgi:hypothetical protein